MQFCDDTKLNRADSDVIYYVHQYFNSKSTESAMQGGEDTCSKGVERYQCQLSRSNIDLCTLPFSRVGREFTGKNSRKYHFT